MSEDKIKIAILTREETIQTCIGKGCFRAFNNSEESFERYKGKETELVAFCHDGSMTGDTMETLMSRIERFKKYDVQVVHLSTCLRGKNPHYDEIIKVLEKDFTVVGYTHGSAERKIK